MRTLLYLRRPYLRMPIVTVTLFLFLPWMLAMMGIQEPWPLLEVYAPWCGAAQSASRWHSFEVPEPASSHLHPDSQHLPTQGKAN